MKKSLITKAVALAIMVVSILTLSCSLFESNAATEGVIDPSTLSGMSVSGTGQIATLGNQAITIMSVVGSVVAVIVLIVLGLKYMMGSTEEKAEYKKTLLPYVIDATFIFAASAIAGVVYNFAINIHLS